MKKAIASLLIATLAGCVRPADTVASSDSLVKSLGGAGVCVMKVEPALAFQYAIARSLVALKAPDPNNTRISNILMHCDGEDGAIEHLCGTAARMNSVGYIDAAYRFYVRFDSRDPPKEKALVEIGAKADALCHAVGIT